MTGRDFGRLAATGLILLTALPPLSALPLGQTVSRPASELRKEIVPLKYIDAGDMLIMLGPFRGPDGSITVTRDADKNPVLVLSDSPAVVEKMLVLIRQMDVRPAEILLAVQLISATSAGEEKADPVLAAEPALKDLRKLMGLRSFASIDSSSVRTSEREAAQLTLGRSGEYAIALKPRYIKDGKDERIRVEIKFGYASSGQAPPPLVESVLTVRPGEKTVVGVSKPHDPARPGTEEDRGLVLLIAATLIK
jgi:hypothetical protein